MQVPVPADVGAQLGVGLGDSERITLLRTGFIWFVSSPETGDCQSVLVGHWGGGASPSDSISCADPIGQCSGPGVKGMERVFRFGFSPFFEPTPFLSA